MHVFNAHSGSGDREKSDPFADIEEDEGRLEENELLDDCCTVYERCKPHPIHSTIILRTVLLLCTCATQIVATASVREQPLFLSANLAVWLLFESGDKLRVASDRVNMVYSLWITLMNVQDVF